MYLRRGDGPLGLRCWRTLPTVRAERGEPDLVREIVGEDPVEFVEAFI